MITIDPYTFTIESAKNGLVVAHRTTVDGKSYLIRSIVLRDEIQTVASFKEAVDKAAWAVAVKVEMLQTKTAQRLYALEVTDVMELT